MSVGTPDLHDLDMLVAITIRYPQTLTTYSGGKKYCRATLYPPSRDKPNS
jgi:hypothetical protein